jgi:Ca2+-binding EF-hand superfamily protein
MSCLKKTVAALAVAGIIMTSAPLMAQDNFQKYDANGDGKVTMEEFQKAYPKPGEAKEAFQWYDRNGDGTITQKEMSAAM